MRIISAAPFNDATSGFDDLDPELLEQLDEETLELLKDMQDQEVMLCPLPGCSLCGPGAPSAR